jgi:Protein of unknown function, DUF481
MKAIFLLLSVIYFSAKAQLVNIEARRIHSDSIRQAGEFNFDYSYSDVNKKKLTVFNTSLVLQQKSKNLKNYLLLLANAELSKARNENFENAAFLHLRFNHKFSKLLRWEAFAQLQSNLPIGIKIRYLTGTGPRLKLLNYSFIHLYLGSLYMLEYEKTTSGVNTTGHRNSSYVSFSVDIPQVKAELISTTYFQPLFANLQDYRILSENRLDFYITKRFKVQTSFRYFFDSRPPEGINNYTLAFKQGFGWRF